jgi:hypothetical protein
VGLQNEYFGVFGDCAESEQKSKMFANSLIDANKRGRVDFWRKQQTEQIGARLALDGAQLYRPLAAKLGREIFEPRDCRQIIRENFGLSARIL